ncbi:MAG: LytTR family DNA-binding domain-containing protein [Oscillospiraceae bacterium]|jgi:two-component system LytT family response regulator|nr:LytTR family DNA-binding domain-containing protein [Oscillospiraceae bacterium]
MQLVPVLIADDDSAMRGILKRIIEKSGGFQLVGEAADGERLLQLYDDLHPALVILDVEMPGKTGVACARVIQDTDPGCMLIFATAHEQYMADAFQVYAFDYLLKPFKIERALKTLDRVKLLYSQKESRAIAEPAKPTAMSGERIMLKHREGVRFLDTSDILLIQREDRATVLYTRDGNRYVTGDSLADMASRLNPAMFFRCHKSYIVNLHQIDEILPYGRWTYTLRLRGIKQDALITQEKYEELSRMFP